jgi:hypothetical protein
MNNHQIILTKTANKRNGNTRPRKEINHQRCGSRWGARQARRKKMMTNTLSMISSFFVKFLNLVGIYEFPYLT